MRLLDTLLSHYPWYRRWCGGRWYCRTRKTCGAYVCQACVQREAGRDLCPAHATSGG
jgi:hypothetical protein